MSDSQLSPYNDVSQTMWSLTDVVAAVNLGAALPACSVMVELIIFCPLCIATLGMLRETHVGSFKSLN